MKCPLWGVGRVVPRWSDGKFPREGSILLGRHEETVVISNMVCLFLLGQKVLEISRVAPKLGLGRLEERLDGILNGGRRQKVWHIAPNLQLEAVFDIKLVRPRGGEGGGKHVGASPSLTGAARGGEQVVVVVGQFLTP